MKKLFFILLVPALFASCLFGDYSLAYEDLPNDAKAFLNTHFYGNSITWIEQDSNEFEVDLKDGTEITFDSNGQWISVERNGALPITFIPDAIVTSIATTYPNIGIIGIEKESSYYDVELDNNRDLDIEEDGTIISDKQDN